MKEVAKAKPVRHALRANSTLLPQVRDGLNAVKESHRNYFDERIRSAFADSLDIDKAFRRDHPEDNRWDYLLGHQASGVIVGVEPHSAKDDEISTIIQKRRAAIEQLRTHLGDNVKIEKWLWVASGKVHFANTEKARVQLDQNGIEFVGTRVTDKHLPPMAKNSRPRRGKK